MAALPISYTIFLTNAAQVAQLQAQYPNGIQIPPAQAQAQYNVAPPIDNLSQLSTQGGIEVNGPGGYWINSSTFWQAFLNTETFSYTFTDPYPWPIGFGPSPYPTTLQFFWVGTFLAVGAPGAPATVPRFLGARRWANGFEIPTRGEGPSGQGQHSNRDASRTSDGYGFAYRANDNDGLTETLPGVTKLSWERFYIRLRTLSVGGEDNVWGGHGTGEGGTSLLLNVNTTGQLVAYGKGNAAYPGTNIGTTAALQVGKWYRVDLRIEFLTLGGGKLAVFLNGVLQFSANATTIANNQNHGSSTIGGDATAISHGAECDFDDWINAAEVPASAVPFQFQSSAPFPGNDLTSGSHVTLVRPTGFGPTHNAGAWTGDYRSVNNNPADPGGFLTGVISNTGAVRMEVTTDYVKTQFGCASIAVGAFLFQVGGGAGQLGVQSSNVAIPLSVQTFAGSAWRASQNIYSIATGAAAESLPDLGQLTMVLIPGPGAGNNQVNGLMAAAEMLGVFGPEDTASNKALPRVGIHNSPYPKIIANNSVSGPVAGVRINSGIYTGNNLGQDILSRMECHWVFIRAITGSNDGVFWWSSMMAAHKQTAKKIQPWGMPQALIDPSDVAKLQIAGTDGDSNNGTYQWIAVSDPAMRYIINGAFSHKSTLATPYVNALIDAGFTPDAAFLYLEDYTSATAGHYFKGIGHATDTASLLDAAVASGIATLNAGSITSKQTLHTDIPQVAYSAWRKNDGSGASQWWDQVTYTGNGGGARNIAVNLGGYAPLFVMVVPHNDLSYYKDPSHAGANSSQIHGAANFANVITAGAVNQVSIGNVVNANAVVYDLFAIRGGLTAFVNPSTAFTGAIETQRTGGPWAPSPPVSTPGQGCVLAF